MLTARALLSNYPQKIIDNYMEVQTRLLLKLI